MGIGGHVPISDLQKRKGRGVVSMKKSKLNLLWTNADPITAEEMLFKYAINSRRQGWWDEVLIIIWGGPAKLVAESSTIQSLVKQGIEEGVTFSACKSCTDNLEVSEALQSLGVEIVYWGEKLTTILKQDEHLITI